ncbi:sphingosine-1-phosphate phosphatase 2-like isoform X2 [Gigantopelta aegis]|uniref:sphingosine-1-phosphate phosphatase 2-like isoform X2 n=1 Tax=Gigantopelta aegis TaxID=1735272 RepID=UPI001B88AA0C|nr:sphingosine-1-phosphate phosphatase 2-like isoform X2 [Gigantopelta aegis]
MEKLMQLKNPEYVRKFQGMCGVLIKQNNNCGSSTKNTRYGHRHEESRRKRNRNCPYQNENNSGKTDVGTNECNGDSFGDDADDGHSSTKNDNSPVAYEIKYKLPYYLAQIGAFLGDEIFYFVFYSYLAWNLDMVVARHTAMVWSVVMYLGQRTKDYLQWPRPPAPPVIHLEACHLHESSMPSTHAMAGTAMPIVLAVTISSRYECSYLLVGSVAVLWCALVCLSRLYLGVHTILDVLCGFISSIVICAVMIPCLPNLDYYQQHHAFAPLVILIAGISLCTICYPTTEKHGAKAKAVEIVSVTTGICVGLWINYQLGFVTEPHEPMPYQITAPTLKWTALTLCRFVCGSAVLGVGYILVKTLSVRFFSMYFGLDKVDERHPSVRMAHKFVTYFVIGFMTTCGAPMFVFKALGIERISAFYECY